MCFFFFNDTATTEIYTLSLHDALPISRSANSADVQLWQDLERVVEQAPVSSPGATEVTPPVAPESVTSVEPQAGFTEPMPWGPPKTKAVDLSEPSRVTQVDSESASEPELSSETVQPELGIPDTTTWPPHNPTIPGEATTTANVEPSEPQAGVPEIPLLKMPITRGTSPSPIVHPLRPQKKKLKSLSAVDLPSFPRPSQNAKA